MTQSLLELLAAQIYEGLNWPAKWTDATVVMRGPYLDVAEDAINTVLEHFSDPKNVTAAMIEALKMNGGAYESSYSDMIAAAMKAAKEEQ